MAVKAPNTPQITPQDSLVDPANKVQQVDCSGGFYAWRDGSGWLSQEYYGVFIYKLESLYQSEGGWGAASDNPNTGYRYAPYDINTTLGYGIPPEYQASPYPISWRIGNRGGYPYSSSDYIWSWINSGANVTVATTLQKLTCDRTYRFSAYSSASAVREDGGTFPPSQRGGITNKSGDIVAKTSPAAAAVASALAVSGITAYAAQLNAGTYTPNTYESVATVSVQVKSTVESWPGRTIVTYSNQSGYSPIAYGPIAITGLSPSTLYQLRVIVTRNTSYGGVPLGDTITAETSFTTLAAAPEITTNAATSVGALSGTLNATLDPNNLSTTVSFQWGPSTGNYTQETAAVVYTGDTVVYPSAVISGLTSGGTTYYYRAKAVYAGGTLYGSEHSFSTVSDPSEEAKGVDLMQTIQFDGQYGTAKKISFTLKQLAATNNNVLYSGTKPAVADFTIVHTTSAGAISVQGTQADNTPDDATGTYVYSLTLSAAEMSAEIIDVIVHSADTGTRPFRDVHIQIRTAVKMTTMELDATNAAVDTTALVLKGKGTGAGLQAVGGASGLDVDAIFESNWLRVFSPASNSTGDQLQLDSGASATSGYYVGSQICVVGGGITNGQGQSRVITAYDGTSKTATVDSAWTAQVKTDSVCVLAPGPRVWDMKPEAELASVPSAVDSYGKYLQLLFQRFAFKIMQETQQQTWYDSNDAEIFIRTVSDDGSTQLLEKLGDA